LGLPESGKAEVKASFFKKPPNLVSNVEPSNQLHALSGIPLRYSEFLVKNAFISSALEVFWEFIGKGIILSTI